MNLYPGWALNSYNLTQHGALPRGELGLHTSKHVISSSGSSFFRAAMIQIYPTSPVRQKIRGIVMTDYQVEDSFFSQIPSTLSGKEPTSQVNELIEFCLYK